MPKLPRVSGKEVIKALSKIGFNPARQKGSHIILVKETADGRKAVVVSKIQRIFEHAQKLPTSLCTKARSFCQEQFLTCQTIAKSTEEHF